MTVPAWDWVFLAVLLVSVAVGAWRGLVFELMSLASWIAALLLARWLGPQVGLMLPLTGASDLWRTVAGYVSVFLVALLVGGLLAVLARKLLGAVGLRPVDRVLGALFGCARAVVVLVLLTVVAGLTPLKGQSAWAESWGVGVALALIQGAKPLLPQAMWGLLPI